LAAFPDEDVPHLATAADCSRSLHGGWYFDEPESFDQPGDPTLIPVCPCTGERVTASGSLRVVYGHGC
jgi:hypothetical protein